MNLSAPFIRRPVGTVLLTVWIAFTVVFMGARLVVLLTRARGDAWLVTGIARPTRSPTRD